MTDNKAKALKKANQVLTAFRSTIDEVIPIQIAHAFLIVAENEGKGVIELADLAGANKSTMSRHLLDLSDQLRTGQPGYGLLVRSQDPTNLRSVIYSLAPKGKLLVNQLTNILEG